MPNTNPVIDDAAIVDFILRRARDTAIVRVAPMAAMTKGLGGEVMTEIGALKEAGAVAVTDGNRAVANARVFRRALSYANDFDMLVVQHVEEPTLASGVMNTSETASRLGLPGIPAAAEVIMLERDLRLVELTGSPLSRRADFLSHIARRDPYRQAARTSGNMRRFSPSSHAQ